MTLSTPRIVPCLWFDDQAQQAAEHYTSIFSNSRINTTTYYSEHGKEIHGKPPGSVLVVEFELERQQFTALNGGPQFPFSEAISLQVMCDSQDEIDYYWEKLTDGGAESQCGWLKDRFGLSWQVAPAGLSELMTDPAASERVMAALFTMVKLDMAELWAAAAR